jgi:hypothetical protein
MKTQAWGWLVAAVMAAGLNASYHDGGLEWAHRIANRVSYNTSAVLALATGRADQFLAAARMVKASDETAPCRFATALARVQTRIARSEVNFDRFEAMSDRQKADFEVDRARIEAQVARMRMPAMVLNRIVPQPRISICPRVRVSVPQLPAMKMPVAPVIHIDTSI